MARRRQVESGTVGGVLFNGCLALVVLALVAVVVFMIRLASQPERDEAAARAGLRARVEAHRLGLARAAPDGVLRDAEIARLFPRVRSARGLVGIDRQGEAVTVTAQLLGAGPSRTFIFVDDTEVEGCYAFHVPPAAGAAPRVSVRRLPDETCATAPASPPAR